MARSREVIGVLAKHGLGMAADRLPWWPNGRIRLRSPDERPLAVHLREALEELGTTFIKVGQVLSTHPDLLPADYLAELSRLQDSGPTVDGELIREAIEADLDAPIAQLFAEFDLKPLAAASIGQVHAAKLPDGREVVVKVQKPGVAERVEVDLDILHELAARVLRRLPDADLFDPEGLVEEFARTIRAELDYVREGRNADQFRGNFADDPSVRIPLVHWSHTTRRVITLERLRGVKLDDLAGLEDAGFDRRELAQRSARLIFREVFEHGCFHADPHPGNFLVLPDGALGALDFGMVGRLDESTQACLLTLLVGFVEQDVDRVVDALEALGMGVRPGHRARLRQDVALLLKSYHGQPLEAISLTEEIDQIAGLLRRHRLRLPSELSLLLKALSMAEGVGRHLDPGFVATAAAGPYLRQALVRRALPGYWVPRLARTAMDSAQLGLGLPTRLERILGQLERGETEIGWRPEGFGPVLGELNAMVNRLAISILASAFVVGTAVLLLAYRPAGWDAWLARALLALGLIAVVALGVGLAINLWQARRR